MENIKKKLGLLCMVLLLCVCGPQTAWAAGEGYTYAASSNRYTLNVKSGDNITGALTEALEAAVGTAGNPAVIVIPAGSYSINLVKLTKSYVTISAEGATIKFAGSNVNGQYVIKATDTATTGVKISGGTWDGAGIASAVFHFGGETVTTKNLTIENCTVKNADQNVKVNKGTDIRFSKVSFEGANYGAMITNTTNLTMTDCSASRNGFGLGLRFLEGTNTLENCSATGSETDGIQVKESGTVVNIKGGSYNGNTKNGISMTSGATLNMTGVDVSNNKSNGISPVGASGVKTTLNAVNCKFNGNGRHGVAGDTYATINVTDSEANNNASNGIILNKGSNSTGLANCITNGNGAAGILVQEKSSCPSIKNITANNNGKIGISIEDVATTIEKCTTNGNTKYGIYIEGIGASKKVSVKDCSISNNKVHGMCITDKTNVTITGTEIKNNSQSGIESRATILTIKGSGNEVSGNKKYGLFALSGKMNISNAVVSNNAKAGVYYMGTSTSGYCINSILEGNATGIGLYKGAVLSKVNNNTITGSKEYGISCGTNPSGRKTAIKQCKNNKFSNPDAKGEIYSYGKSSLPSGMKNQGVIKFAKTVKAGKKTVSGTAFGGAQNIKITVGTKTYTGKITGGKFTVKTAKLAKKTKIKAVITDKNKNTFTVTYTVK